MSPVTPTIAPPKRKKAPKNRPDDGLGSICGCDSQVVLGATGSAGGKGYVSMRAAHLDLFH